ncbi:hypothetical protein M8C21_026012, partial [Ambrosia artemisiifolia]
VCSKTWRKINYNSSKPIFPTDRDSEIENIFDQTLGSHPVSEVFVLGSRVSKRYQFCVLSISPIITTVATTLMLFMNPNPFRSAAVVGWRGGDGEGEELDFLGSNFQIGVACGGVGGQGRVPNGVE